MSQEMGVLSCVADFFNGRFKDIYILSAVYQTTSHNRLVFESVTKPLIMI